MKMAEFLDWLDSFLNFEKKQQKNVFWLDTIRFLSARFGNPQDSIPCIHVAGSKGKGSVAQMSACIMEAAGFRCGVYTSPHIRDFRERIGTAGGRFPEEVYEAAADELYAGVSGIRADELPGGRALTWFELVTEYAFLCFRRAEVDWAVYETGLGGRLDSTNVVLPRACILTPIELEHTEFLGSTIGQIAAEKAGIIKRGVPVIVAPQRHGAAGAVFLEHTEKQNAQCIFVDDVISNLDASYQKAPPHLMRVSFEAALPDGSMQRVKTVLSLRGTAQAQNAAAAAIAAKTVLPWISDEAVSEGLSRAALPGRFEIREVSAADGGRRTVVLDGAHTADSIALAVRTLRDVFPEAECDLLFACAADKAVEDIAPLFRGRFRRITVTRPGYVRESNLDGAAEAFLKNGMTVRKEADCRKAASSALADADGAVLLVAGSFYLVAEAESAFGLDA